MSKLILLGLTIFICTINHAQNSMISDTNNYFLVPNSFYPEVKTPENNLVITIRDSMKIESFEMQIFNRWGSKVFVSSNLSQHWDGKVKKEDLPAGSYVYLINASLFDKIDISKTFKVNQTGVISIIR